MIKCMNCTFYKERFTRCNKVIGHNTNPKYWYNNEIYATRSIENKNNNCSHFNRSLFNTIKYYFVKPPQNKSYSKNLQKEKKCF